MSTRLHESRLIQYLLRGVWLLALVVAPLAAPGLWTETDAITWVQYAQAALIAGCLLVSHPVLAALLLASFDVYYVVRQESVWLPVGAYLFPAFAVVLLAARGMLLTPELRAQQENASQRTLLSWAFFFGAAVALLPLYFDIGAPWPALLLLPWCLFLWASLPRDGGLLRDAGAKLAGSGFFLAVLLLTLEGGARMLFEDRPPNKTLGPHEKRLVSLLPGSESVFIVGELETPPFRVQVSTQGLRDRVYPPKSETGFRILALGDSTTFGWGVPEEDSFPKQLEAVLGEHCPEKEIEVINAGTPTYAPWQSLSWLHERAREFEPDQVIYTLFPVNDAAGELEHAGLRFRSYDVEWEAVARRIRQSGEAPMRLDHWLRVHSRFYQALTRLQPEADGPVPAVLHHLRALAPSEREHMEPPETAYPEMELNRVTWYPELEQSVELVLQRIAEMKTYCESQGWAFAVCVLPSSTATCQPAYDGIRWRCSVDTVPFEACQETRVFETRLTAAGIATVAPLEAFRASPDPCALHLPNDGHLSVEGNRLLAEELAAYMGADVGALNCGEPPPEPKP